MKVLITGATGQVGRSLAKTAVHDTQLLPVSHKDLDIADADAVLAYVRSHAPEVIINAAAHTAVDRAESESELAQRVNAAGPRHLAAAARAVGARLIHISTDFVFDGKASVPYHPEAATAPASPPADVPHRNHPAFRVSRPVSAPAAPAAAGDPGHEQPFRPLLPPQKSTECENARIR